MSRILLIGCGETKQPGPVAASQLYTGSLTRARIEYAEREAKPGRANWYILSARHGLVRPDRQLVAYNATISDLCEPERSSWALGVARQLLEELPDATRLCEVHCELHAGADYAEQLFDVLLAAGLSPSWPVKGMTIHKLMSFYKRPDPIPSCPC